MKHVQVAIVVPYYKTNLSSNEAVAWRHLHRFLGNYEVLLLLPENLDTNIDTTIGDFQRITFPARFFADRAAYSRLLLSPSFYKRFTRYEYILIYQLDCLVLMDRLSEWCIAGFDYIGSPFFRSKTDPMPGLSHVGNGGFSLRRVEASLQVLTSSYRISPRLLWAKIPDVSFLNIKKRIQILRAVSRGVHLYREHYSLNEDLFWSNRAQLFDPAFKIAPVRQGLQFGFEKFPRYCFAENGFQLPFGVHAWAQWDRAFWEPYLL